MFRAVKCCLVLHLCPNWKKGGKKRFRKGPWIPVKSGMPILNRSKTPIFLSLLPYLAPARAGREREREREREERSRASNWDRNPSSDALHTALSSCLLHLKAQLCLVVVAQARPIFHVSNLSCRVDTGATGSAKLEHHRAEHSEVGSLEETHVPAENQH